jgi:hypothetical protein
MRGNVIQTVKQPEYTGENRCIPCTLTNVVIAGVLGGVLASVGVWVGETAAGVGAGIAVFAVSLVLILLRGYLVPGTPTLTKRYFPARLLALFGKAETTPSASDLDGDVGDDPDAALVALGVLDDRDGDRARLADEFRTEWSAAVDGLVDVDEADVAAVLGTDGDVDIEEWGDAFRIYLDDELVGTWRSRAAFRADVASASTLSALVDDWADVSVRDRAHLFDRIRTHVDTCPECGGAAQLSTETVEGCCATHESTTAACDDCGTRLYIETCPNCGSLTEYGSKTVECDDGTLEVGTRTCIDCTTTATTLAVPPSMTVPDRS